jgi:hypothetical protein
MRERERERENETQKQNLDTTSDMIIGEREKGEREKSLE